MLNFKRILTIDDLIKFCKEQNFAKFSSSETGYQLAVKIPTTFEVESQDENHRGMTKLKIKIFHEGINRNNSKVTKESAEKAMKTIPDRPVLAAIHQLSNGDYDFAGHEMETIHNDETDEDEIKYIESQVGSFSSEPAFWEHDDKLNKDFVCAYAYISNEYTKANEIIRRKGYTKNSCELCIDEMSYEAKSKCLNLVDFYVSGSTLLGTAIDDEHPIEEGMQGSRADIVDFSVENNSVKFNVENKLFEMLDKINNTLSNFNKESMKGGNDKSMSKFEELLEKYNKTVEDITFDYEELSDEELEEKFEEVFGESNDKNEKDTDDTTSTSNDDNTDNEDNTNDDTVTENNACGGGSSGSGSGSKKKKKKNSIECTYTVGDETRTFSVSLQDKIYSISDLVNQTYADADNTYYAVNVYQDYVVMYDYCTGRYYKQSYTDENDNYTLTGDRVEVFAEFVTSDEQSELNDMRANYSAVVEELNQYKYNESFADKMTVFDDDAYADYLETKEFKSLMAKESVDKYSKEELVEKADATLGKLVKSSKRFSYDEKNKHDNSVKLFKNPNGKAKPKKRYGNLFD